MIHLWPKQLSFLSNTTTLRLSGWLLRVSRRKDAWRSWCPYRGGTLWMFGFSAVLLIACDSNPVEPEPDPPPADGWVSVAVGNVHTCALRADGRTYCWGGNTRLQTGSVGVDSVAAPVLLDGSPQFGELQAGGDITCGRDVAGAWHCWGANPSGQLGRFGEASAVPVQISLPEAGMTLTVGSTHLCALGTAGTVFCWGSNRHRKLGRDVTELCPTSPCSPIPAPVLGVPPLADISAGLGHTCGATSNGQGWCWGWQSFGQVGNGVRSSTAPDARPTIVPGNWRQVSAGDAHSCAVDLQSGAACWGGVHAEVRGAGTTGDTASASPVTVEHSGPFATVVTGLGNRTTGSRSCGVLEGGEAFCWGLDYLGQLGTIAALEPCRGPTDQQCASTPVRVDVPGSIQSLVLGRHHSCGLTTDRELWCWGDNAHGQIGVGGFGGFSRPQRIPLP